MTNRELGDYSGQLESTETSDRRAERILAHSFDDSGWTDFVKFVHSGEINNTVHGVSTVIFQNESSTAGNSRVDEVNQSFSTGAQSGDWGTTGDTYPVSTHARLIVGDDTSELIYQINVDESFANTMGHLLVTGFWDAESTTVLK